MAALEVENLRKDFASGEVLRGVTFSVERGDIVSVIGSSGCGKTTLFRCILGELAPDDGVIRIDGQDVTHVPIERRGTGLVPQSYALFPHLTVAENVAYGLRATGIARAEAEKRTREMLETVQLGAKGEAFPSRLSGGERQRVALARALAVRPRLLLLDEAFTALDPTTRSEVVQEVRSIIRRLDVTTLLITHDQEEAFLFARKVLVLHEGQVVIMGSSEKVMAHPDPFVRGFVKMVHLATAKVERDPHDGKFVQVANGARLPVNLPNVKAGDVVHVMVKKTGQSESFEVWSDEG